MTHPIAPALTSEQWADFGGRVTLNAEPTRTALYVEAEPGYVALIRGDVAADVVEVLASELPALIAVCNAALPDDDPRKIRHGPVRLVRDAAEAIEGEWGSGRDTHPMARALRRFADALDSYLPSEGTTDAEAP